MEWFHIGIAGLNAFLYIVVTFILERQFKKKIIKPIIELTNHIKNPKHV